MSKGKLDVFPPIPMLQVFRVLPDVDTNELYYVFPPGLGPTTREAQTNELEDVAKFLQAEADRLRSGRD